MSDWPRVILLGDSITQYAFNENGWGSHIAGLLQRKCDIFNRGFSGYTTQYIVKILGELINTELVQVIMYINECFANAIYKIIFSAFRCSRLIK